MTRYLQLSERAALITCSQLMRLNECSHKLQDIEFDLIGVDASIANALRRIMLAEVRLMLCAYQNKSFC
jgi:DNA-directed RNA polymerase subunit L